MIIDFNNYSGSQGIAADLCIIGGGAAGITIAKMLKDSGMQIVLLESGGMSLDAATQGLYDVENRGLPRHPVIMTRLRMFGGTTNHWDGRCAPLDELDFQAREWIPHSGWPITKADLDPYYAKAQELCELGPYEYGKEIFERFKIPDPGFDEKKLKSHVWQFSPPTRFSQKYHDELERSPNIRVFLNANVINIQTDASGRNALHVDIKSLSGKSARVMARRFVLACGGIENPRILLASDKVNPAGVGNGNGLVGRYFMEHLRSKETPALLGDAFALKKIFNIYRSPELDCIVGFRISEEAQREREILNGGAMTYFEGGENSSTNAAFRLAKSFMKGDIPSNLKEEIRDVIANVDELLINVRRDILRPGTEALVKNLTAVVFETEQAPNPDSRISLSEERDALGIRKAAVDWRLTELDRATTLEFMKLAIAEFGRLRQARFRVPEWLTDSRLDWGNNFKDVGHHIGATRMSAMPGMGVVDANCRMHEVENLFVAGASVFSTGGHVNPTLTIVALAARLAGHLRELHKSGMT